MFFALWPPPALARSLHRIATTVGGQAGGRCMARDTLHLTLAFIGEIPADRVAALEAVAAGLAECRAFSLKLDRLGYWPRKHLLWAAPGAMPEDLEALVRRLHGGLEAGGFAVDKRGFTPHLTLVRKLREVAILPALDVEPWVVGSFCLVASRLGPEGARYRTLGSWALASQPGPAHA